VCVGRPPVYCIYVNCVVPLTTKIVYFVRSRRRVSRRQRRRVSRPEEIDEAGWRAWEGQQAPPHQLGDVGDRCNLLSEVWAEPQPKLD